MKKVAREAGVSAGILHYYFPDKRAILVAALEAVAAGLDARVAAAQARSSGDAGARLRSLVRACLQAAVEDPEVWIVFVEFWGEMVHDARLRRVNADLYARLRRSVGALVVQGIRAGQSRRVRPEEAGAVILALIDGVSLQLTFDPAAFDLNAAARICVDAVERYLDPGRTSR
jgi:AcrR family transcriptional regulator